jgi:hypothetical protein
MQIIVCLQLLKLQNAQIEILSVYAWAISGDFGISLTQALNPATIKSDGYFLPVYDDAAVYADLLTRLNVAIPKC